MINNPALGTKLQDILKNEGGVGYFQRLIPNSIGLILVAGVVIFFFVMIIGAIQWITSGGDKAGLEAARGRLTSGIIGMVILLSVFAIIKIMETFFGINILTIDIGPLKIQ